MIFCFDMCFDMMNIQFIIQTWHLSAETLLCNDPKCLHAVSASFLHDHLTCTSLLVFTGSFVWMHTIWLVSSNLTHQLLIDPGLIQSCCTCRPEWMVAVETLQSSFSVHVFHSVTQGIHTHWAVHIPNSFSKHFTWMQIQCWTFAIHQQFWMIFHE